MVKLGKKITRVVGVGVKLNKMQGKHLNINQRKLTHQHMSGMRGKTRGKDERVRKVDKEMEGKRKDSLRSGQIANKIYMMEVGQHLNTNPEEDGLSI